MLVVQEMRTLPSSNAARPPPRLGIASPPHTPYSRVGGEGVCGSTPPLAAHAAFARGACGTLCARTCATQQRSVIHTELCYACTAAATMVCSGAQPGAVVAWFLSQAHRCGEDNRDWLAAMHMHSLHVAQQHALPCASSIL